MYAISCDLTMRKPPLRTQGEFEPAGSQIGILAPLGNDLGNGEACVCLGLRADLHPELSLGVD